MITSSDRSYKSTKRIKQGKTRLRAPFDELAEWIARTRKVTVLNVIYARATSLRPPRLEIVLEHPSDVQKFDCGATFDRRQQKAVKKKFLEITARNDARTFDVNGLFVIFSAFSPVAKEVANSQIPESEIQALKTRIGNPDLWEISRFFRHATFFFFTDAQVKKYEQQGKTEEYTDLYFELLEPHDEFGYWKREDFETYFDSKQNFDENYEGNWFYYYK